VSLFFEAGRALLRNPGPVGLYIVVAAGTLGVKGIGDVFVGAHLPEDLERFAVQAYQFGMDLFLALGYTAASVIAFSRLGRAIDRPLWKVADDREAFRRFFVLWLILNLGALTIQRLFGRAVVASSSGWADALLLLMCLTSILVVPAGACLMFAGHPRWRTALQDLAPLASQWPKTMGVLFINYVAFTGALAFVLWLGAKPALHDALWLRLPVDAGFLVVDCYAFAATWLICVLHRRAMEERDRYADLEHW